jgi:putative ABC transport system permease protein
MESYLENRYGNIRGESRFRLETSDQYVKLVDSVLSTVNSLVAVIASVSLLVGGLGIMNIMLVTVSERTREIGVRMAIGARRRDILSQFLIEAVTICLIGGALGTAFGAGIAGVACAILDWSFVFSPQTAAIAFLVSSSIGLLFGTYPAHKASRLTPIEALRAD